jgi:general secretion pathway protein K
MTRQADRHVHERGLALVSVLWALSILSLIAASMMSAGSISYAIERNALKRVEADSIADAGITLGILGLLDPRPEKRWRVDGVRHEVMFAQIPMTVEIQDTMGLIDLNEADVSLLGRLFQGAGLGADDASGFAARIVDWRTPGDLHSLDGASKDEYRAAGLSYVPRGGPFQSIDELNLVLGMTPELYARVSPALTVYSRQPNFDPRLAPREALLSLSQMSDRQVDQILSERLTNSSTVDNLGATLPSSILDPTLSLNGHVSAITAELTYRGIKITREAVIRLTADNAHPYRVLAWH